MKFETFEEKAIRFTVELSADIDTYAKDFLALFNCQKANSNMFLSLDNQSNSRNVYATFLMNKKNDAQDYLEQFGKIIKTENVNVNFISAELSDEEEEKYYEKTSDRFLLILEN